MPHHHHHRANMVLSERYAHSGHVPTLPLNSMDRLAPATHKNLGREIKADNIYFNKHGGVVSNPNAKSQRAFQPIKKVKMHF